MTLKQLITPALFLSICFSLFAQQVPPPSTAYTRSLLRSADAAAARNVLGVLSTNATAVLVPDGSTIVTNGSGIMSAPGAVPPDQSTIVTNAGQLTARALQTDPVLLNRARSAHLWNALQAGGLVKYGAFGDSMQDVWRGAVLIGITNWTGLPIVGSIAGAADFLAGPSATWQGTDPDVTPDTNSWLIHMDASPPAGMQFAKWSGTAYVDFPADHISVYWVTLSGGGAFDLQIRTNNGSYGTFATIDTSGSYGFGVTNIVLPKASYSVMITNLTGRVVLPVYPHLWDSTANGIDFIALSEGGIAISNILRVRPEIVTNVFAQFSPDLLTIEDRHVGPTDLSNTVNRILGYAATYWTNSDAILLGTHYWPATNAGSPNTVQIEPCNLALQNIALSSNVVYFEPGYPQKSYEDAVKLGFASDQTHWLPAGGKFKGQRLMDLLFGMNKKGSGGDAAVRNQANTFSSTNVFSDGAGFGGQTLGPASSGFPPLIAYGGGGSYQGVAGVLKATTSDPTLEFLGGSTPMYLQMVVDGAPKGNARFDFLNQSFDRGSPIVSIFNNAGGAFGTGQVGIGTTNPAAQLDVVGTGRFRGNVQADGSLSASNLVALGSTGVLPIGVALYVGQEGQPDARDTTHGYPNLIASSGIVANQNVSYFDNTNGPVIMALKSQGTPLYFGAGSKSFLFVNQNRDTANPMLSIEENLGGVNGTGRVGWNGVTNPAAWTMDMALSLKVRTNITIAASSLVVPTGSDVTLWNSNGVLYGVSATKTNVISDLR